MIRVEQASHRCCRILLYLLLGVLPVQATALLDDDELIARLNICFNFGCNSGQKIALFESDWRAVRALFAGSGSAQQERDRIAAAIAMMEAIVSVVLPTGADRAGNDVPDKDFRGQMDCIDESNNATTYLQLLQDKGLLRWHQVRERVYRAPLILDEHWAAQIEQVRSGERFAVDSWPRAHAMPAVIQPLADWHAKREPMELAKRSGRQ
ncbi:MAG: hypothetical protein ACI9DC_003761 [Gammaproteobacteria bacterium]|jgi:hypothetical protein